MADTTTTTAARRRSLLRAFPLALAGAAGSPAGAASPGKGVGSADTLCTVRTVANPDAALIECCGAYTRAVDAYNASGGDLEYEVCPHWQAVEAARAQLLAARAATTLAGVLALARVAQHAARQRDGSLDFDTSFTGQWPGQVVEGLLRIAGGEASA